MRFYERLTEKDKLIVFIKTKLNRWTAAKAQGFEFTYPDYCKDKILKAKCQKIDQDADAFADKLNRMNEKKLYVIAKNLGFGKK